MVAESQVKVEVCLEVVEAEGGEQGGDGEEAGAAGADGVAGRHMAPPALGSGHSFSSILIPSAFFTRSMWALDLHIKEGFAEISNGFSLDCGTLA